MKPDPRFHVTCEWCARIVSVSRELGDLSNPIRLDAHSATARFWHTACAKAEEDRYIDPRFHSATAEQARINLESK